MTESAGEILIGRLAVRLGYVSREDVTECRKFQEDGEQTPLGDLFLKRGLITPEQLVRLQKLRKKNLIRKGEKDAERAEDLEIGRRAVRMGVLSAENLAHALRVQKERSPKGQTARLAQVLIREGVLRIPDLLKVLQVGQGVVLICSACGKRFNSRRYRPDRVYECRQCGEDLAVEEAGKISRSAESVVSDWSEDRQGGTSLQNSGFIGDYELMGEIASGSSGTVFRAQHSALDRTVAIKILLSDRSLSIDSVERFRREARATARLSHPHIVKIHDVGVHAGQNYIVMDYVEGRSLGEHFEDRSLDVSQLVARIEEVARAIDHAHRRGIIHRDLTPSNVILDGGGTPRITDFGLAKNLEGQDLSQSGVDIGTPYYMPPEQVLGRVAAIDRRSDVWSLGVILYQGLTGDYPFPGENPIEVYHQILHVDPRPPHRKNPDVTKSLSAIVLKAIEKAPRNRYRSARALAEDLSSVTRGEDPEARLPGWRRRLVRSTSGLIPGLAVFLLMVLFGLSYHFFGLDREMDLNTSPGSSGSAGTEPESRSTEEGLDDTRFQTHLALGETSLERFEFESARKEFAKAIELKPEDPKGYCGMARALASHGQREEALGWLAKSIELDGFYWEAYRIRGRIYMDQKKYAKAYSDHLRVATRFQSDDSRSHFLCAQSLYWKHLNETTLSSPQMNVLEQIRLHLNDALALDAKRARAYFVRGNLFLFYHKHHVSSADQNLRSAISDYSRSIDIDPKHVYSWINRGLARMLLALAEGRQKGFEEAFSDLNEAYEIDPDIVGSFLEFGIQQRVDAKRFGITREELEVFLARLRGFLGLIESAGGGSIPRLQVVLGLYHLYQKNYGRALLHFEKEIVRKPYERKSYYFRGLTFEMMGRFEDAERDFKRVLETDREDFFAWLHLGKTWMKSGQFEKAVSAFEKAVWIGGQNVSFAFYGVGMVRFLQKRWGPALKAFREGHRHSPQDKRGLCLQALVLATDEDNPDLNPESALDLVSQTLRYDKTVSLAWGVGARAYFVLGQKARAVEWAERGRDLGPVHWYFDRTWFEEEIARFQDGG